MALELSSRCLVVERRTFLEVDAEDDVASEQSVAHRRRSLSEGQLTGSFSESWLDKDDDVLDLASTHVSEIDSDSDQQSRSHTSGSFADTDDEEEAATPTPVAVPLGQVAPQMMFFPVMPFGCQMVAPIRDQYVSPPAQEADHKTTLVFKNMPLASTRSRLREGLDREGFAGLYDFVYVRTNFKTMQSFGYGFVNFLTHDIAERARLHFHDAASSIMGPDAEGRSLDVSWTEPYQGLQVHIEHFRNSPLMHEGVPDEYKPLILCNGERVQFPPPTKQISPPKELRRSIAAKQAAMQA